jgi:AcrR family transcriptional regulator
MAPTKKPTRRPWGSLDREQIVEAALTIARTDGIDALSIRRLAADLGASRMALYRHVEDKEALLELAAGAIAEHSMPLPDIEGTSDEAWEDQLRALVRHLRETLRTYPGLTHLLLSRGSGSPATLAISDRVLGILRRAGLGEAAATRSLVALFDIVLARASQEAAAGPGGPERRLRRQLDAARTADPAAIPFLADALPSLERLSPEDVAETELEWCIAGVRALVAERAALDPH